MKYPGLLAATLALAPVACNDDSSPAVGQPLSVPLVSPQSPERGSVTVSNSESTLRVDIAAGDGWTIRKARAAGGTSLAHIPQKKGEPLLSRFPLRTKAEHGEAAASFHVPLFVEPGTVLTIAVQADIRKKRNQGSGNDEREHGDHHDDDDDDDCINESAWGSGSAFPKGKGAMYFTYTVQKAGPPTLSGLYRTHSQETWGLAPTAANPAGYLSANFGAAFPGGLVLGSFLGFTATFRSPRAVEMYLPEGGAAVPLDRHLVDPRMINNVLLAETTALAINAGLDAWDPNFAPGTTPLQDLVVAAPSSRCFGMTVREVLALANDLLGGLGDPAGLTPDEMLECVRSINSTFEDGATDRGYLGLP